MHAAFRLPICSAQRSVCAEAPAGRHRPTPRCWHCWPSPGCVRPSRCAWTGTNAPAASDQSFKTSHRSLAPVLGHDNVVVGESGPVRFERFARRRCRRNGNREQSGLLNVAAQVPGGGRPDPVVALPVDNQGRELRLRLRSRFRGGAHAASSPTSTGAKYVRMLITVAPKLARRHTWFNRMKLSRGGGNGDSEHAVPFTRESTADAGPARKPSAPTAPAHSAAGPSERSHATAASVPLQPNRRARNVSRRRLRPPGPTRRTRSSDSRISARRCSPAADLSGSWRIGFAESPLHAHHIQPHGSLAWVHEGVIESPESGAAVRGDRRAKQGVVGYVQ